MPTLDEALTRLAAEDPVAAKVVELRYFAGLGHEAVAETLGITIYVARQNNVLFSVLAQYFGPEAINDRLVLIETISFTTTPDEMLEALTRIIADRPVGQVFFGNDRLMDFELMGGDGRRAIMEEDTKRKINPTLPPLVPFGSHQWPALITPGPGAKTLADLP